jgi:hypothetical protein
VRQRKPQIKCDSDRRAQKGGVLANDSFCRDFILVTVLILFGSYNATRPTIGTGIVRPAVRYQRLTLVQYDFLSIPRGTTKMSGLQL